MSDWYRTVALPAEFTRARAGLISGELQRIGRGFRRLPSRAELSFLSSVFCYETSASLPDAYKLRGTYSSNSGERPGTGYPAGSQLEWVARGTNTGPATVEVDGRGPKPLRRIDGTRLSGREVAAGLPVHCFFDGWSWRLLSSAGVDLTVLFKSFPGTLTMQRGEPAEPVTLSKAVGGTRPYAYSAAGLPGGLRFDAESRSISGAPEAKGDYEVEYTARDAKGRTRVQVFLIRVVSSVLSLPDPPDLQLIQDRSYDLPLPEAAGGTPPYEYEVSGLPGGLAFDPVTRQVYGTARPPGVYRGVSYRARSKDGQTAAAEFDVTVVGVGPLSLPLVDDLRYQQGRPGDAVTLPEAAGGTAPHAYALAGLPAGLRFDAASREISGTPSKSGVFAAVYSARDSAPVPGRATTRFRVLVDVRGSRYAAAVDDRDAIDARQLAAGTRGALADKSIDLPAFAGEKFIVVAQPAAIQGFPPLTLIGLGTGNAISAFELRRSAVSVGGIAYDLWVGREKQGAAISGASLRLE